MAEENTDEWELSKENVQPLRQGRSFAQLSAALKPNTTAIRQQQEHFETEIRTYDGEDPLDIWIKYISWTEQTFPKGGKDGDLQTLLKNCVIHFKDDTRYHNDPRCIKIWMKFADYTTDPGQLFEYLFNQKIGCQIADFYEAWALWFERCGNYKMADAVYNKGFELGAQPLDRLQKRHSEFQTRVSRAAIDRIRSGEAMDQEPEEAAFQRSHLGDLRPLGQNGQVPVVRIGSDRPARLPHTATRPPQVRGSSSVQIYHDENAASCRLPPQNREFVQVPLPEMVSRENRQKPAKWTDVQVKQKGVVGGSSRQSSQLPFTLHEDADIQQPLITPHKIADGTGILSVRQEPVSSNAFDGVILSAEAPDQKVMYCKEKLFVGVREFSFEELRAVAWFHKKRQEREFEERLQQEVQRQLQLALQSMNSKQIVTPTGNQLTSSNNSDQSLCGSVPNGSSSGVSSQSVSIGVSSQSEDAHMEVFHSHQSLFPVQNESTSVLENFSLNPVPKCTPMELGDDLGRTPINAFALPTDPQAQKSTQPSAATAAHSIMKESGFSASKAFQGLSSGTTDLADVYMATPDTKAVPSTRAGFEPKDASFLTRPSPTVHTKHAMELVRNMFGFDDSIKQQSVPVDAEFENQFLLDSDETVCTTSGQLGKELQPAKPQTFAIFMDPSPAKLPETGTKQQPGSIIVFEDPPSPKALDPSRACPTLSDPSFPRTSHTVEETGGILVYEDPAPSEPRPKGGMTGGGGQSAVGQAMGRRPVPDKENVVGRRALRSLIDQDVLPSQPAAERDEGGPSAFTPVRCGQQDVRGDGRGTIGESGVQLLTGTLEQIVPGTVGGASASVPFSDEILDEPEEVQMADAGDWCIDAFDPTSEMTFDPRSSSTRNLTQMVRSAGGVPGYSTQPLAGLRELVSDSSSSSSVIPQLQDAQGKTFNTEAKSANAKKSSFYFYMDTIQEASEESKSRSSVGSRSSSSRPLGTGSSSSSGSSGCRSSLHHHLSQSTNCSAIKQLTIGCQSAEVTSGLAVTQGLLYGLHTTPGDRIVGKVADMQSFIGEAGPGVDKDNDNHEVSFQPDQSAIEEAGRGLADTSVFIDQKNPYNAAEIQAFLRDLSPPLSAYGGYHWIEGCLPKFAVRSKVRIGDNSYTVKAKLGEGGYAKVYHIVETSAKSEEENAIVAKVQSPACPWEFYITSELHRRLSLLKDDVDISPSIMSIDKAFFYDDGNCFFNQRHCHGTLLDFVNSYKLTKQSIPEWLVLYISIELFHIVEQMHKCQVIHGDFKPDNILIVQPRHLNADETGLALIRGPTSFLKLIDFGQSIDMTMFPPGTTFLTSTSAFGFQCPEVLSHQPWTYQPDYFGLISTIYALLVGNYLKLFRENNMWSASLTLSRSLKARDIWKQMLREFLNISDCDSLPNLQSYRSQLEAIFLEEFSAKAYNNLVTELEASRRNT